MNGTGKQSIHLVFIMVKKDPMEIRRKQQLFGIFTVLLSAGFSTWSWYTAIVRGYFYVKASIIFPAFLVIGAAILFLPGYREERLARGEDISALTGYKLITPRWWTVLVLALGLGIVNYALLNFII